MFDKLKSKVRSVINQEVFNGISRYSSSAEAAAKQAKERMEIACAVYDELDTLIKPSQPLNTNWAAIVVEELKNGNDAAVLAHLKQMASEKRRIKKSYLDQASEIRKAVYRYRNSLSQDYLKVLFDMHSIDEFCWEQFADIYKYRFPIMQAAPLTQQYVRRRRMKQIGNVPDRWLPYSKEAGLLFADMANVRHAKTEFNIPIEKIKPRKDIVIKPMVSRGSIGAYLITDLDHILVPKDQILLKSWDEMLDHAKKLFDKKIIENTYMIQEFIYADALTKMPAHDLKFYTFYGEIGCVNEICRDPGLGYWWYTPEGKPINIGINNPPEVSPIGFKPEYLKIVQELSSKIPCPHMRIDFLVGEDGIYFSEFCSQTGSEVERILEVVSPSWDRSMGNMYLKAEMRIINDLLAGKRFDEINEFNRICDKRYRKK